MLASSSTPKYKSPYSPRVTSLRQQVISGHPATRASPQFNSRPQQPFRGQLGGDQKGERRVSEATIINHRPPLPPSFSGRSQSLDGLLDDNSNCVGVGNDDEDDDEGAPDVVDGRRKVLETTSLEVLLDENDTPPVTMPEKVLRPPRREERSKSVDNYLGDKKCVDSMPRTRSPSEKFCEVETMVVDEAKVVVPTLKVTVEGKLDTAYNSEEEGPRTNGQKKEEEEEGETTSTTPSTASMSRQNSTTSSEMPERKKTFINRLGKRVRSMIKK